MEQNKIKFASICLLACVLAAPAYAQAIDTSGLNNFFVSVINALTGLTGRLFMTIVAVGALIAGAVNVLDWGRVIGILVIIVLIGGIPTIVDSIWLGTTVSATATP